MTNSEIMNLIEEVWFIGADTPDFYGMPMFKYKDWYIQKLEALGLTHTGPDWKWFVENKIGDIEKWIEENKPE